MAISEKAIDFMQTSMDRGRPVPGQSLTNSPEQPYKWEKAAEFTNPKETMLYVFETLTVPETVNNLLESVAGGVGIIDLASIVLYSGFLEGKWNPDLMTLLMEPTMYMIIALAEKAGIEYKLEAGDISNEEENVFAKENSTYNKGLSALEKIKSKAASSINPQTIPVEIQEKIKQIEVPQGLLSKTKVKEV